MTQRLQNWQIEFAGFAAARASMPFSWGRNDCYLFAADAVRAMTGHDFAADLRGTYATTGEAARLMVKLGGLAAIASEALGESVSPLLAAVGDVVLCENAGRELLAICNGGTALAPGENGMEVLGMDAAIAAWRV